MPLQRGRLSDIQAQQVEVGRIRLGTTQEKQRRSGTGTYQEPVKLERLRFTSRSEQLIKEVAARYGGEVQPWEPQSGGAQQWQVIIEATSVPVIVPPNSCSQFYEQWARAECTRRCDGLRELLSEQPCLCGPDPADKKTQGCKPTTRVSLMLAELPGVGVWRLETHGYYAASELPAVVDLLTAAGGNIPARLEMEERSSQIPDPRSAGKTITSRFMVPVLHVEATPAAILGALAGGGRPALGAAPAATPAEIEAAPTQDAAEAEAMKKQWTVHAWYENKIAGEATAQGVGIWAEKISQEQRLQPDFREDLLAIARARIELLQPPAAAAPVEELPPWGEDPAGVDFAAVQEAAATQPTLPLVPVAPAPVDAPMPAGLDRTGVFNQVNQAAAKRRQSLSWLKQQYGEFAGAGGGPLATATAEQLWAFLQWIERGR